MQRSICTLAEAVLPFIDLLQICIEPREAQKGV